jgi:hypothetical protein
MLVLLLIERQRAVRHRRRPIPSDSSAANIPVCVNNDWFDAAGAEGILDTAEDRAETVDRLNIACDVGKRPKLFLDLVSGFLASPELGEKEDAEANEDNRGQGDTKNGESKSAPHRHPRR